MRRRQRFTPLKGSKATAEPNKGSSPSDAASVPKTEKRTPEAAPKSSAKPLKRKTIALNEIEKYQKRVGFNTKDLVDSLGTVDTPSLEDERRTTDPSSFPTKAPQPSQESLLEKFWKLGESNIFMGGGVGVALAALAFLIGGAPRFAIVLLCVAWLMISVSIYKHRFFERRSRRAQILGNVFACSSVAIILVVAWLRLIPSHQSPEPPPLPDPSPTVTQQWPPAFILRHKGAVVFADFPQPLMYEYGDNILAPIGLALNIEVVNNKPGKTKIIQYVADIQTPDGHWHRALSLPMSPLHTIYFLNQRRIDLGMKCEFEPAIFDVIADNKILEFGEPLEGWMFFEWPAELRNVTATVQKLRLTVKNAQNQSTESTFDSDALSPPEQGASLINSGGVFCSGVPRQRIDLSSRTIKPYRD